MVVIGDSNIWLSLDDIRVRMLYDSNIWLSLDDIRVNAL